MTGNITLSAASFAVLTTGFGEAGPDAGAVLREAGVEAGRGFATELSVGHEPVSSRRFWDDVADAVRSAGLGSIRLDDQKEAWLVLVGTDLADASPHDFTAGVIEGLLTAASGHPVGTASSPDADGTRFVAGAPRLVASIGRRLARGTSLENALPGDADSG